MRDDRRFFINGQWVEPLEARDLVVVNPADNSVVGRISLGGAADVERAVQAARAAFPSWTATSANQRREILERITAVYARRMKEVACVITREMGSPISLSLKAQAPGGWAHFKFAADALKTYAFEERRGGAIVRKEAVGVCALITPWNWPATLIASKVAAALAAGCTMVLKPSEAAPLTAHLIAEILEEAGVPPGVFNLIDGLGPEVGEALACHPEVDMISITGSTLAGIAVAKAAAGTVKRVAQELGGKSACIVLDDADLSVAIAGAVVGCFTNSGQTCLAPTRLLVPRERHEEAVAVALKTTERLTVGDPSDVETFMGPLVNDAQFVRVQSMIEQAITDGAQLVTGGLGKPQGLEHGCYVRPTVFAGVTNDLAIAREEIFGPVLCILPYDGEDDAIRIANDSPYGLAGYVCGEPDHARQVAERIRAGYVLINLVDFDLNAPFGGYKQSGNGREWGPYGFSEYLEIKSVVGGV